MIVPPIPVAVTWDTCVVKVDASALSKLDRRLMRKAKRRVSNLTGIRFKRGQNPIPGIRVWYTYTDNYAIAQTALQSRDGAAVWAGVQLFNEYWDTRRRGQVLKHELLHAVGVGHSRNPRSIMYHQHRPGQSIRKPLRVKLRSKYAHCHRRHSG